MFEFSWYFLGIGKVQAAKMVLDLLQVEFGRWRLLRYWAGTGFHFVKESVLKSIPYN